MSTKSIKSTDPSRVSARTYRARRRLAALLAALLAVCLWLAGANWGMSHAVAQAEQATTTATSHARDVEKSAVPAPKPSAAAPESKPTQAQPQASQAQAQPGTQPTDVQAYRAWLASLPQSLDDIPACQVETGEDIDAETADVTVYVPVCRWDASISGNGRGESYVLAYGHKVMPLNYR